jgi:hypothetical protein
MYIVVRIQYGGFEQWSLFLTSFQESKFCKEFTNSKTDEEQDSVILSS